MSTYRSSYGGRIPILRSRVNFSTQKRSSSRCFAFLERNVSIIYSFVCNNADVLADLATTYQTHHLYLTLLTLLFAYAYDSRTTQHDPTPESAWTICALVPAFSALDPAPYAPPPPPAAAQADAFAPGELAATFAASYRRALAFPLFRSWALAERCRADVGALLRGGRRGLVRCLLELKGVLDRHDVYYVYAKIWVDDFCVWVQACARCVPAVSSAYAVLIVRRWAGTTCCCAWRTASRR